MPRLTVVTAAFSVLLCSACGFTDQRAAENADLDSDHADPVSGQTPPREAARRNSIFFDYLDSVAVAAELPRLRDHALPESHREVRIWIGGGRIYPQHLYRFVDRHGQVDGEVLWYWPVRVDSRGQPDDFHDGMLDLARGRCEEVRISAGMAACRVSFTQEPDWARVLQEAESVGLWTMVPDPYVPVPDGTIAAVELRAGSTYRAYEFNWLPESSDRRGNPSYDLSLALDAVTRLIPPMDTPK